MRIKNKLELDTMQKLEDKIKAFFESEKIKSEDIINNLVGCLKNHFGFAVLEMDLQDGWDGLILVDEEGKCTKAQRPKKVIAVNKKLKYFDKLFTVAHEFAHYILTDNRALLAYRDHSNNPKRKEEEDEADYVAAALLLPKDEFYRDMQKFNGLTDEYKYLTLQAKYGVSNYGFIANRMSEVQELCSGDKINE